MNEGGQAKKIEDRWFNRHSSCPDPNNKVSSNSLKLESFWGLFLIAGVASSVALLIFAGTFLFEHKDMLMSSDSEDSLWKRIRAILKQYDLKDHNSHTFRHELAESVYDAQRTLHLDIILNLNHPERLNLNQPERFNLSRLERFNFSQLERFNQSLFTDQEAHNN